MTRQLTPSELAVPADETPAADCPYCGLPFQSEHDRDLHVGQRHADEATDAELDAYEAADDDELADLWYFHMKVVFAIGIVHAIIIGAYMAVWG
jgi:hypothetical protein